MSPIEYRKHINYKLSINMIFILPKIIKFINPGGGGGGMKIPGSGTGG
jgi:hypothetical protein